MKTVAYFTVGCKLNQFETEQIREAAEALGYRTAPGGAPADVCVVNTCTVTHKSDYRSRQAVRRAVRSNPGALVIVTGCYAQRFPQELARIPGVGLVVGNSGKGRIAEMMDRPPGAEPAVDAAGPDAGANGDLSGDRHIARFGSYTRAFVKVQDGCNNMCSYCAVPLARGRSRSKPPGAVRGEVELLASGGYKEVVLTGVHLGRYGADLGPGAGLAGLLRGIATVDGLERIRLSSVEPNDFTEELIDLVADPGMRICPHVHVPLQSGDDGILKAMGRRYDRARYARLIESIAGRVPGCGIGLDVMVGFPGESESAFRNTYDLIAGLPVTYLHCFSYSPRPGTRAYSMADDVPPEKKRARSRAVRDLGRRKGEEFRRSLVGSRLDALVLSTREAGRPTALSGNYVRCVVTGRVRPNDLLTVRVMAPTATGVLVERA